MQCSKQLAHAEDLPWQDQIGRNFAQRLQNESAQVSARVRQLQALRSAHFLSEGNQVEVEGTRFVEHRLRLPTELLLQRLKFIQQAFRCLLGSRLQTDDRVYE